MTFMSDIRSGIARVVEREQHQAATDEWSRLMEIEADNFEFNTRWVEGDVTFDLSRAQLVA